MNPLGNIQGIWLKGVMRNTIAAPCTNRARASKLKLSFIGTIIIIINVCFKAQIASFFLTLFKKN
jgi:hypothetical protein